MVIQLHLVDPCSLGSFLTYSRIWLVPLSKPNLGMIFVFVVLVNILRYPTMHKNQV